MGVNLGRARSWLPPALALAWVALIRVPLVLNAASHLDSDLAVDGLTLADALRGQWRWHYPGTPHIGTIPVLASLSQALIWGANPRTLVGGGVVLYGLVVLATYALNRRAYGASAAAWGLVPVAFAGPGLLWLSGRITGGHLLVAAWGAAALALMHRALAHGGLGPALGLGLWCGLGLYADRMFLLVLVAVVGGVLATRRGWRLSAREYDAALAFVVGGAVGFLPHWVGGWVDPYDAYGDQFVSIFRPIGGNRAAYGVAWEQAAALLAEHGQLLARDCLPRLVAGLRLPGLEAVPPVAGGDGGVSWVVGAAWAAVALGLFAAAMAAAGAAVRRREGPPGAVGVALALLAVLAFCGFLFNRNIFNSDNYRYLVLLILPWSAGAGRALERLARAGRRGRAAAAGIAVLYGVLATAETALWYRGQGWVEGLRPAVRPVREPALDWLREHPAVSEIHGPYWVVYRLAFLADRPLRALPWADEPRRFPPPERRVARASGRDSAVAILTPGYRVNAAQAEEFRQHADGELLRVPGLTIYRWR